MFARIRNAFVFARPVLLLLKGKGYVPAYRLQSQRIFVLRPTLGEHPPQAA
jgi:hypothetical protein